MRANANQTTAAPDGEGFDFVIVGGGTAGCVLANRLSADGRHSVLLIEAGEAGTSPWIHIPAGFYRLLTNPRYNWRFETSPEAATNDRIIAIPRGKGLGGSTLINGMIYVRGQRLDYDGWAQLGCTGWGFDDVLPIFRTLEDFAGAQDAHRGRGGPLPVVEVGERPAIAEAFIGAAEAAGYARNMDYNAAAQDGFGYYQVNQRGGRRISAAAAYLKPAIGRPNLRVVTGAHVTGIELDGRRAVAVTARKGGRDVRYVARGEVVLAAGAVQTPHLLELSGIGDPAVLSAAGIAAKHELPGVGANYLDHFCTRMSWRVSQPVTLNEATRGWRLALAVAQYAAFRRGILTFGTGLAHGFVRTREGLEGPDVQYFFMHASYANAAERKLDKAPGMTLGVTQLRPQSRGTIHAATPDPFHQPTIRPNFLADAEDRRVMVEGMKIGRRIVGEAPLDAFRVAEISPGAACASDADWLAFARANGQTIYHAGGTCRMGPAGQGAVVDPRLRVHGMDGLRVVDASVMPTMVSGNTQAAVFMIAEKGAEMILADAKG